jgi:hypothetical protein
MFVDVDTTTSVSETMTIGHGCSLLLRDGPLERHYGPGDHVVLEIRHGLATVNGVMVYQRPRAPDPDLPAAYLARAFSRVPSVRHYVDSHHI